MVCRGPEPHPCEPGSNRRSRSRTPDTWHQVDPFLSEAVMSPRTTIIVESLAERGDRCAHRRERTTALVGSVTTAIVAFWLLPASLDGQGIDYGALEQLFKEPVTTSVNGSPQRVSDVPATIEIITAEEIRRSGAKDIPGVLRHVGGIDTLEWGNDNVDIGVRGYNQAYSPRLLVLVDGRQVDADDYGYTPWSAVPVELGEIRQIEVVKGPNSALFGFNAVDGVINIVTYNPLYDKVKSISLAGGTQELTTGSTIATHKFGN